MFAHLFASRADTRDRRLFARDGLLGGWRLGDDGVMVEWNVDDLMSAAEISAELGWQGSSNPSTLWKRGSFPAPVVDKPRGRLWLRSDVEEWARTARRRPWRRLESSD